MKILLIDDDAFLRDMYTTKFQERGDEIIPVASGEEALTLLRQDGTYDAVVTDMVMPGMSGVELLQKTSDEGLVPQAVKVVLSNQSETTDKEAATNSGAHGYLVKADLVPSQVVEEIHRIIGQAQL